MTLSDLGRGVGFGTVQPNATRRREGFSQPKCHVTFKKIFNRNFVFFAKMLRHTGGGGGGEEGG